MVGFVLYGRFCLVGLILVGRFGTVKKAWFDLIGLDLNILFGLVF